ncbi:MAG TPA: hypothetical protein EYH31_05830, partial [Anaerolineae bacterium]|nr:hypothetical protein [Anaerolineae bacterium]
MKHVTPKSHSDTVSLFRRHFVSSGQVDVKYARWLGRAEQDRLHADHRYDKEFNQEDAQRASDRS